MMKEEIFGPVMPVFPFKDIKEVIKFINDRDKPLAVYYFGDYTSLNSQKLIRETSSGAYVTNEVIAHINSHHFGFGGVGMSGYGRHGGYEGFKNFSNRKSLLLKKEAPPAMAKNMMPPFGPKMTKFLRNWMVTLQLYNISSIIFVLRLVFIAIVAALAYYFFF